MVFILYCTLIDVITKCYVYYTVLYLVIGEPTNLIYMHYIILYQTFPILYCVQYYIHNIVPTRCCVRARACSTLYCTKCTTLYYLKVYKLDVAHEPGILLHCTFLVVIHIYFTVLFEGVQIKCCVHAGFILLCTVLIVQHCTI